MKRSKFALNGIMTIRKYKELIARKSLIEARQPLVKVDEKIQMLEQQKQKVLHSTAPLYDANNREKEKIQKERKDSDASQLLYNLASLSSYSNAITLLHAKRKFIKKEIEPFQKQYGIAKNKLETMQILYRNFKSKETKKINKEKMAELQEIMLC